MSCEQQKTELDAANAAFVAAIDARDLKRAALADAEADLAAAEAEAAQKAAAQRAANSAYVECVLQS